MPGLRHQPVWLQLLVLGLLGASIAVRWIIPVNAVYQAAHDDQLLVLLAANISDGQWLGDWNNLTLAKPPGYSLFLVAAWAIRFPPPVLAHALYLIGAYLILVALIRFRFGAVGAVIVFACLSFNPALFGMSASRVYRDGLLVAQVALIIGFSMVLGSRLRTAMRGLVNDKRALVAALFLGVTIGWAVLTKKDVAGIAAACAAALLLIGVWPPGGRREFSRRRRTCAGAVALVALGIALPIGTVSALNYKYYRYAGTEDFYSGAFSRLWSAWARVDGGSDRRWVPITHKQRELVYAVSPTAKRLRPYLEGLPNTGWRTQSCAHAGFCDESGPWFNWDLRDAMALAGLATTAGDFQQNLETISDDITRACADGRLECSRWPAPAGLPVVNSIDPAEVIADTWLSVRISRSFLTADPAPGFNGVGPPEVMAPWREVVAGTDLGGSPWGWEWRFAVGRDVGHSGRQLGTMVIAALGIPIIVLLILHAFFGRNRRRFTLMAIALLAAFALSSALLGFIAAGAYTGYATAPAYTLPGSILLVGGLAIGGSTIGALSVRAARRWLDGKGNGFRRRINPTDGLDP